MRLLSLIAISAGTILSMVQYAPAPFLLVVGATAETAGTIAAADGAIGGGILGGGTAAGVANGIKNGSGGSRRSPIDLPAGVSQNSWDLCQNQLNGATVNFSGTTDLRLDGLPPACMDLATVFTGNPTQEGGPVPTPMGSASIQYTGLTSDEWDQVGNALKKHGYSVTN